MSVLGVSQLPISTTGAVNWNNGKLRVALVLDNTGSMADNNKIGALRTATHNLLTQLQSAAQQNGDVYVSIVPFVKDVNVGAEQLPAALDRLDRLGRQQRQLQQHDLHDAKHLRRARPSQDLDAGQSQHLERLRHRPRPELRHAEHDADHRRQPVPGRAVFVLPDCAASWLKPTTGPRSTARSTR